MKNIIFGLFVILSVASCKQSTTENASESASAEAELVQKPLEFKNDAGENLTVTYYSEGDLVAVKLTPIDGGEQRLVAKTVNHSGNPIFTNENYMWEIVQDGQAGKLSNKSGKTIEYRLTQQAD